MSKKEHHIIEGEIYFGNDVSSVSTLLGSCVSVVVWHPKIKVGGMCHIVLPESGMLKCTNRYANCAIKNMVKHIERIHTRTKDYVTYIYGGGEMFAETIKTKTSVGWRNVEAVKKILLKYEFRISEENIGGRCYRTIKLDINTGNITHKAVEVNDFRKEKSGWTR